MNQSPIPALKPDLVWIIGIILLALSGLFFFIPNGNGNDHLNNGGFFFNYLLAIAYFFILWGNGRLRRNGANLPYSFLLLNLALLSCYALNHLIGVFAPATPWFTILLILGGVNYCTFLFLHRLPPAAQCVIYFVTGISFVAFLYLAIVLIPTYLVGLIASIVIGLSLHLFVPGLFLIYTIVLIRRSGKRQNRSFFAGVLLSALIVTQYAVRWHYRVRAIENALSAARAAHNGLPDWIGVAEHCQNSTMDETILKTVITEGIGYENLFGWRLRRSFDEKQDHSPLVVIASFFSGATRLDWEQRSHILNALYDARHKTERRLWSGDDLVTTDLVTDVQLWPQLHLSYTEENVTVANKRAPVDGRWTSSEEALYTFHLAEGAVVSSLSLWINGKEQKGILSSRGKADSAYTTIVGREFHDPSVVHWQEGNTVVVRVYPVTAESRQFKLGITAPMEKTGNKLAYHSVWFEGPSPASARSTVRILPMEPLLRPEWPASFQSDSNSHLRYPPSLLSVTAAQQTPIRQSGGYTRNWTLSCEDPGIAKAGFHFGGKQYVTATPDNSSTPGNFRQVYLDLNSSWSAEEYESLLTSLTGAPIYASLDGDNIVPIAAANKDEIFAVCSQRSFSLFPLYRITDDAHSLLVSKSTDHSPNLSDLNESVFARQLQQWLDGGRRVRLYHIGEEPSSYLRALRETGAFQFEKGDLYTLQSHLHHHEFPAETLATNEVLIEPAGVIIRRSDDTTAANPSTAPDHLLRLFAYQRILQQLKGHLPGAPADAARDADTTLVPMAQEAGIVSPVSSYVVLESQADYDRFNIHEDKNGLKNASLHGTGSAPEPGEWAILLSVLAVFAYIRYRRGQQQRRAS